MLAFGYAAYALGKMVFAHAARRFGGLALIATTVFGGILLTLLFTAGNSIAYFGIAWSIMRFLQAGAL
jgi:hypothetical protein